MLWIPCNSARIGRAIPNVSPASGVAGLGDDPRVGGARRGREAGGRAGVRGACVRSASLRADRREAGGDGALLVIVGVHLAVAVADVADLLRVHAVLVQHQLQHLARKHPQLELHAPAAAGAELGGEVGAEKLGGAGVPRRERVALGSRQLRQPPHALRQRGQQKLGGDARLLAQAGVGHQPLESSGQGRRGVDEHGFPLAVERSQLDQVDELLDLLERAGKLDVGHRRARGSDLSRPEEIPRVGGCEAFGQHLQLVAHRVHAVAHFVYQALRLGLNGLSEGADGGGVGVEDDPRQRNDGEEQKCQTELSADPHSVNGARLRDGPAATLA